MEGGGVIFGVYFCGNHDLTASVVLTKNNSNVNADKVKMYITIKSSVLLKSDIRNIRKLLADGDMSEMKLIEQGDFIGAYFWVCLVDTLRYEQKCDTAITFFLISYGQVMLTNQITTVGLISSKHLSQHVICPVGWGCRIRVRPPPKECPGYGTKQSDGEVPMMLGIWRMQSTPLLPSLPGSLWPSVVAPDRTLSIG